MDARHVPDSLAFRLIYEAAKDRNEITLQSLIDAKHSIDVRDHRGLFTPAARLAAEGKDEAVELLLSLGANPSHIAMGYASVGMIDKAEELRKSHQINLKYLAIGAALYEDKTYAEALRAKYDMNQRWFIYGAAAGGDVKYADELLASVKDKELYEKSLKSYIKGLVMAGKTRRVVSVLDDHKEDELDYICIRAAIRAAARMKNEKFLGEIIYRNGRNKELLQGYYEEAALGAASGGHIKYAKTLLENTKRRESLLKDVIFKAMLKGHFNETISHITHVAGLTMAEYLSNELTMRAAFLGRHATLINALNCQVTLSLAEEMAAKGDLVGACNIVSKLNEAVTSFQPMIKGMDESGYYHSTNILLYMLSFIQDNAFLEALSEAALAIKSNNQRDGIFGNNNNNAVLDSPFKHLLFGDFNHQVRLAVKVSNCMSRYNINFDQAKALVISDHNLPACKAMHYYLLGIMDKPMCHRLLVGLYGLNDEDAGELINQYALKVAKNYVDARLDRHYKDVTYWIYTGRHKDRADSIKADAQKAPDMSALSSMFKYQYDLFNGKVNPNDDPRKPKYMQPLNNKTECNYSKTCDDVYHSKLLKK